MALGSAPPARRASISSREPFSAASNRERSSSPFVVGFNIISPNRGIFLALARIADSRSYWECHYYDYDKMFYCHRIIPFYKIGVWSEIHYALLYFSEKASLGAVKSLRNSTS